MWRSSLRFYRLALGPLGMLPAAAASTARMALYPLKHARRTRGKSVRVVVDARPLSHPQAGGFRSYVRGLVLGLAPLSDLDILLYLDRDVKLDGLPENFKTRVLSPDRLKSDLTLFARQVRIDAPDLVHGTMNYVPACGSNTRPR